MPLPVGWQRLEEADYRNLNLGVRGLSKAEVTTAHSFFQLVQTYVQHFGHYEPHLTQAGVTAREITGAVIPKDQPLLERQLILRLQWTNDRGPLPPATRSSDGTPLLPDPTAWLHKLLHYNPYKEGADNSDEHVDTIAGTTRAASQDSLRQHLFHK